MQDLQGKVAVITGAGSGIGEGIAHAAARAGMKVVVADIDLASLEGKGHLEILEAEGAASS